MTVAGGRAKQDQNPLLSFQFILYIHTKENKKKILLLLVNFFYKISWEDVCLKTIFEECDFLLSTYILFVFNQNMINTESVGIFFLNREDSFWNTLYVVVLQSSCVVLWWILIECNKDKKPYIYIDIIKPLWTCRMYFVLICLLHILSLEILCILSWYFFFFFLFFRFYVCLFNHNHFLMPFMFGNFNLP